MFKKTPAQKLAKEMDEQNMIPLLTITLQATDLELKEQKDILLASINTITTTALYEEQILPAVIKALEQVIANLKKEGNYTVC